MFVVVCLFVAVCFLKHVCCVLGSLLPCSLFVICCSLFVVVVMVDRCGLLLCVVLLCALVL